jgi:hypothetical protein
MQPLLRFAIAGLVLPILCDRASAGVAIEQIEAPESGNYAPVDFPSRTTTSAAFPGIMFIAQSNVPSTASAHAGAVGREIYGASSPASGAVSRVYAEEANHFIQGRLFAGNSVGTGPAPQLFPADVAVANLSFVATLDDHSTDLDAIRRLDTLAAKQSVTVVAGAVSQTSGNFAGDDLFWSCRNALAIRGSDVSTPFDPAGGSLGRTHADLWSDGDSSFATGRVSGYAAALVSRARATHQPLAARDYTIRSLLITGADPAATGGTITPLDLSTPNHFDPASGAGKADYDASLSILNAGQSPATAVFKNTIKPAKILTRSAGYSVLTLAKKSLTAIVFNSASPISALSATLNWDIISALKGSQINTSNRATPLADLALDIRQVKKIRGKPLQLGQTLKSLGLFSDAHNDNVEHLSFDGDLPAGTYAFVLRGDNSLITPAAFSYRIESAVAPAARAAPAAVSIPEPSTVLLGIITFIVTIAIRRRRPTAALRTTGKSAPAPAFPV